MKNQSKNFTAVLITVFIMTSVAYYAQAKTYGTNLNNDSDTAVNSLDNNITKQDEQAERRIIGNERTCVVDSKNTITYCGDSANALIWAIQTKWEENEQEPAPKQAIGSPKATPKNRYVRKGHNAHVEELIRLEAQKQGYDDIEFALDIADCESRFDPNARNNKGNTPSYSTDLGLWQYNDYWQRNNLTKECMLDAECSTKQAIKDLKAGKARQWVCARKVR